MSVTVRRWRKDHVAVLAPHLGLVHGLVGLAQQLIGINLAGLRVERDTQAGGHLQNGALVVHRLGRRSQQPPMETLSRILADLRESGADRNVTHDDVEQAVKGLLRTHRT